MLDKNTQVLIPISPLLAQVPSDPVTPGNGQGLQEAVPAFITDRAIMGVVHHEPLNHLSTEIDGLLIGGGNHQAIPGFDHTAHLDPFDRTVTLHRADPAGPYGPQGRVVAEAGDDDTQPLGRLDDFHPVGDFYFMTVNL
jgi:hypothetical protein